MKEIIRLTQGNFIPLGFRDLEIKYAYVLCVRDVFVPITISPTHCPLESMQIELWLPHALHTMPLQVIAY